MRLRTKIPAILALLAAITLHGAQKSDPARVAMEAAKKKEVVDGDLNGAIQQYKAIVSNFKNDRTVVADALIRMANCYRQLGDAQSRRIYEQVVRDYPDQADAVTLAQARLGGSGTSAGMSSRRVWSGEEVDFNGTVSPDGRYVPFTDWETGDLAIHEFATGTGRRILNTRRVNGKLTQYAEAAAISKDGKRVAYSWWDDKNDRYELRLANLTGDASPRRLYDTPDISDIFPLDWAPDDKSVAVKLRREDRTEQLALVSVPDGSLRVLKSLEWGSLERTFFSPDGRWLGFDLPENSDNPERDVFVLSVDGRREIRAVANPGNQDAMVGWSPDGKWLLFSSDRIGSTDLWAVPFGEGESAGSPQLLKAGFERSTPLGVTTSGALYYGQEKGGVGVSRIQIVSVDIAAGKLSSPVELSRHYGDSDTNPAWSPDGRRLAYLSRRGPLGAKSDVLVIRSNETGQLRDLPLKLARITLDGWAPDGRSLLVFGRDSKGRYGMNFVDAETGDVKAFSFAQVGQVGYNVNWAPNGRSFLIEMRGAKPGVYRVDAGTGEASLVMPNPSTQPNGGLYPKWSADGKSIYYRRLFKSKDGTNATGEDFGIIERDLSSGAERELARRPFFLGPPKPTPDGKYIVVDSVDPVSNSRVVQLIPIAGGASRELMRIPADVKPDALNNPNLGQWAIPEPSLPGAPDSRPLLVLKRLSDSVGYIAAGKNPSELWLVPLGGEEPRRIGNTPLRFSPMVVSSDVRHIAYAVTDPGPKPTTEVWLLENFLPKSEKK